MILGHDFIVFTFTWKNQMGDIFSGIRTFSVISLDSLVLWFHLLGDKRP